MNIVCATGGIVKIEFPNQGLMDIAGSGFEYAMLDMSKYISGATLRQWEKKLDKELIKKDIANLKSGIVVRGVHPRYAMLPFLAGDTKRTDLNGMLTDLCVDCIRETESLGVTRFIAQPLSIGVPMDCEWDINLEYFFQLARALTNAESKILLINHCNNVEGHYIRGLCSDASEAANWVDHLNELAKKQGLGEERFGFCMDIGAYNLCGINMQDVANTLRGRVLAAIVRANDGHQDIAAIPFTCVNENGIATDWMGFIRGMREIEFNGDLIMDMTNTLRSTPSLIRPSVLAMGKTIAEYFRSQIQIEEPLKKYKHIVLFGSGDLGRGFIRSFGEKYRPLFTCDNNSARWGTFIDGIEVKSPECLLDLPEDTGVFICNMYHREIEEQLKNMGVLNVESFDCEFLPAYNQNRVGRQEVN